MSREIHPLGNLLRPVLRWDRVRRRLRELQLGAWWFPAGGGLQVG